MKKIIALLIAVVGIALTFSSCASVDLAAPQEYRRVNGVGQTECGSDDEFHIIRTNQVKALPQGATVGIISAGTSGAYNMFMAAAIEDLGLIVRELNLYSILPPEQQYLTDPKNQFTYVDSLVKSTVDIINQTAATEEGGNFDLDGVVNRMYAQDDLVTEKQRMDHYLEMVVSLKNMISALNVDYILISGNPYVEYSFTTKIYDTKTLDVVFNNVFIADEDEIRESLPAPLKSDNISFKYRAKDEPVPYWEMAYCEFVSKKIEIEGGEVTE